MMNPRTVNARCTPVPVLANDADACTAMLDEATVAKDETAKVHAWRLLKLIRAGCTLALAEEILR